MQLLQAQNGSRSTCLQNIVLPRGGATVAIDRFARHAKRGVVMKDGVFIVGAGCSESACGLHQFRFVQFLLPQRAR